VYVADGWGVSYASLALTAYALDSGSQMASVRTGTSIRCMATGPGGDLVGLTDTRLYRLDPVTLGVKSRIDAGIPGHSDWIAVRGSSVVVANWLRPTVGIVDLQTGTVRRRRGHPTSVLAGSDGPVFLVAVLAGGVWTVDPVTGEIRAFIESRPAVYAAAGNNRLVLLDGKPHIVVDETRIDHKEVRSKRVLLIDASSGAPSGEFQLADGASILSFGPSGLWAFGGDDLQHVADHDWRPVGRRWKSYGSTWRGVDASGRVGVTLEEHGSSETATLRGFALDVT
jgi:hypothetical protein